MMLIDQLKRDEGLRLTPYQDSVGKWTIGYGRNLSDTGISQYEAELLLQHDLINASLALKNALPWTDGLDDARRGVLVNMAFNMGIHELLEFRHMLQATQEGDYATAAMQMTQSKWAGQVGARAERLARQMETGTWF